MYDVTLNQRVRRCYFILTQTTVIIETKRVRTLTIYVRFAGSKSGSIVISFLFANLPSRSRDLANDSTSLQF